MANSHNFILAQIYSTTVYHCACIYAGSVPSVCIVVAVYRLLDQLPCTVLTAYEKELVQLANETVSLYSLKPLRNNKYILIHFRTHSNCELICNHSEITSTCTLGHTANFLFLICMCQSELLKLHNQMQSVPACNHSVYTT